MDDIEKTLKSNLIFGKYKLIKLIMKGTFDSVYLGINIINYKLFAIKIENRFASFLQEEAYILYNLKGPGIPSVISYGHFGKYNILVQTLLGKSLEKIWNDNSKKLCIKDICMIAIQTLDRIQYVHSKNYLHRDIKPGNFLVGYPDNSQIYLIDFGNSRKYRSSRTGKHIQSFRINRIFGTVLFLSMNVLKGNQSSRKDDLESLGYMYIFLAKGKLPWSKIKITTLEEVLNKTFEIRINTSIDILCKDLPEEMILYVKYVENLLFDEEPNYNYLKKLFINILHKIGEKNDNMFSWVDKTKIVKKIEKKEKVNYEDGLHKRLFNKIKLIESNKKKEPFPHNITYNYTDTNITKNINKKIKFNNNKSKIKINQIIPKKEFIEVKNKDKDQNNINSIIANNNNKIIYNYKYLRKKNTQTNLLSYKTLNQNLNNNITNNQTITININNKINQEPKPKPKSNKNINNLIYNNINKKKKI